MLSTNNIKFFIVKAFKICLEERKVPHCMKTAKVIPLFKKKDRNNLENYRPFSRRTSVSKLFVKLLHKRMVRFFQKIKLLSPMQFDFRSKRSCTHSISTITEHMRTQIDNKLSGQAYFID